MTFNEKLKEKIKWKHKVYRDYLENGKTKSEYMYIHHVITEVSQHISNQLISESKSITIN